MYLSLAIYRPLIFQTKNDINIKKNGEHEEQWVEL